MKIKFNPSKNFKNLVIVISILIILFGLSIAVYYKNYKAQISGNFVLDPSQDLVVHISEQTSEGLQPGVGTIDIKSGCDITYGGTQNGMFRCLLNYGLDYDLTKPDIVMVVNRIVYSSYLSNTQYVIVNDDLQIKRDTNQDFIIDVVIKNNSPIITFENPELIYNPADILPQPTPTP